MTLMRIAAAAALSVLVLTACGDGSPEQVTTTVTAPAPPPVTVTQSPAEALAGGDSDTATLLIEMVWVDQTRSERAELCEGWSLTPLQPMLLDSFMEAGGASGVSRGQAKDFFDDKCL